MIFSLFFSSWLAIVGQSNDGTADLFRNLWSPYCKGVSLLECPSSQAEDLRQEIRTRMQSGEGVDAILIDLKQKYGPELKMIPDGSGRESLAYWLPWLAFGIVGSLVLAWLLKRGFGKSPAQSREQNSNTKIDSATKNQILKDLESRL